MMKNKYIIITQIIILTILMIGVSIFFIKLLQDDFPMRSFPVGVQSSNELVFDKTYDDDFKEIIIHSSISEIHIKESSNLHTKVVVYGEKENVNIDDSNTLNIKINDKKCVGFCFNQKSSKIEITLPKEYSGKIKIENDYGDISIDEFLNATMDIKEDCGEVKIFGGNHITVENHYGDIEIEKGNTINIKEDCGDVSISTVEDVTVKNSYGDIHIQSINRYLNLKEDCGDIKLNHIHLEKDSYIKNDYGDIEIENTNEIFIDATTDLGDVKIKSNYHKSDITLKIENDCGDIKVNN